MIQNNVLGMFYLPNTHSKISTNVVSVDVNVSPRYSKPLVNVPNVQITNLDDLNVGKKHWNIKAGHRDFHLLGSVVTLNIVGAILL